MRVVNQLDELIGRWLTPLIRLSIIVAIAVATRASAVERRSISEWVVI